MSESEKDALEVKKPSALAVPEYLKEYEGDKTGTEHITKDDMKMPRLTIAQKMSHQLDDQNAKYIEGLKFLQVFNDLTEDIYSVPLRFTIVRADPPRAIEFRPMDEGGGVIDMNVPINDPRTKWHGKEKPKATVFYDFFIMLEDTLEIVALSLKTTNLKTAKRLNSLMKLRFGPPFTQLYVLDVKREENDKGAYGIYTVVNASAVSEELLGASTQAHNSLKDRAIDLKHENESDSESEVVEGEVVDGKPLPF